MRKVYWRNAASVTTSADANTATSMMAAETRARVAYITAASDNTAAISIGPNSDCDYKALEPGDVEEIPDVSEGCWFDLKDWFVKSTGTSQAYSILYLQN